MSDYTPDELRRYRDDHPGKADLPDDLVVKLTEFQLAVLGYRFGDLGRGIGEALPAALRRVFDA